MTSYTNPRPGAGFLVPRSRSTTASGLLAVRFRTSPIERAGYTRSMLLGPRYPYGRRSTPARRCTRERFGRHRPKQATPARKPCSRKLCSRKRPKERIARFSSPQYIREQPRLPTARVPPFETEPKAVSGTCSASSAGSPQCPNGFTGPTANSSSSWFAGDRNRRLGSHSTEPPAESAQAAPRATAADDPCPAAGSAFRNGCLGPRSPAELPPPAD